MTTQTFGDSKATAWEGLCEEERKKIFNFNETYLQFLNGSKTERETIDSCIALAEAAGFVSIDACPGLKPGDKIYAVNRQKQMALAVIGSQPLDVGMNIIGAHVDSPRLDFKPEPFYEDALMALAKTHYYGGLKKYQWVGIPLALHGVAIKEDGTKVHFVLGEKIGDPVFTIADLLPHLAKDQMSKKLSEAIEGESLNILVGGIPLGDEKKKFKQSVLHALANEYGLEEEDFISAEIEAVPAWPASSLGFDQGFVGGYGQDDRVCVYTGLKALLELANPQRTAVLLLVDKEEVGSMGNTGMQSLFFENFVAGIIAATTGMNDDLRRRIVLSHSRVISADVSAGLDPNYQAVMDKYNTPRLGCGVVLTRYTGARGKSGTSEASAEYTALIRHIFNQHKIVWQTGELGKVDQGGGGTIAYMLANYNMDVIDCGVALLGMHSPFEVSSKVDVYMTYQGYKAFLAHQ